MYLKGEVVGETRESFTPEFNSRTTNNRYCKNYSKKNEMRMLLCWFV